METRTRIQRNRYKKSREIWSRIHIRRGRETAESVCNLWNKGYDAAGDPPETGRKERVYREGRAFQFYREVPERKGTDQSDRETDQRESGSPGSGGTD